MAVSFFDDKSIMPQDDMVADALGNTHALWDEIKGHVQNTYPAITGEWKHYGKAAGWSYKLLSKKRNLLFFVPLKDCFRLRIGLGERGVACVEADDILPEEIKEAFRAATPYVEGRSIDIDISRHEQLEIIKRLLHIKYTN
ncbi:MAG: DUF3788 domain-containing protein [Clostridia bacterium]|nr:DUF3788 domain-containing protein [Clostridia bacterium]